MADKMEIEILEDGTLKVTTGTVSPANHINAEAFLRDMSTLCGGKVTRTTRLDVNHSIAHSHDQHVANGHTHSH